MYLRNSSRTNKDCSKAAYVQLAHSQRDPQTYTPRADVLFNFGAGRWLGRVVGAVDRGMVSADNLIDDATAAYGTIGAGSAASCVDCYQVTISAPPSHPALHRGATASELLATGQSRAWTLHIGASFADVPLSRWAYRFIETLLHRRLASVCASAAFCPTAMVSGWQMAVFLARALHPDPLPASSTVPGLGDYSCVASG